MLSCNCREFVGRKRKKKATHSRSRHIVSCTKQKKMSTVDDLVNSLFPGMKLPPPTKVSAQASAAVGNSKPVSSNSGATIPKSGSRASNKFDDNSDDDENAKSKTSSAPNHYHHPPALPKSTDHSAHVASSSVQQPTKALSSASTAQWPVLPKNLLKVCTGTTCVLSNNVPEHSSRAHSRLLFGIPNQSSDALQERDTSILDPAVGTVNYCAFISCAKCGHPVVRMQDAFVVQSIEQQKQLALVKQQQQQSKAGASQDQQQKKNAGGAHDWDDDSDDETTGKTGTTTATTTKVSVDPMYMLSRNHYPDFMRLDRASALRRREQSALYWCQCTMVSCFSRRAMIDIVNNSAEVTAAILEPPAAVRQERAAHGEVPFSSREIKWTCVGHCQPMS